MLTHKRYKFYFLIDNMEINVNELHMLSTFKCIHINKAVALGGVYEYRI